MNGSVEVISKRKEEKMEWSNYSVNNYEKLISKNNISSTNQSKYPISFQNQFDSIELAKRATKTNSRDRYEKESEQTIGGIDFSKVLFTYEKTVRDKADEKQEGDIVNKHIEEEWKTHKSEYAYFANENGMIEHNGTIFQYNSERDIISLGDMTNENDVLTINLSGGTVLQVNRNNIDDLVKAIDMFKPEDVRRIMEAISVDSKSKSKLVEIEKEINDTYDELLNKMEENGMEEENVQKKEMIDEK